MPRAVRTASVRVILGGALAVLGACGRISAADSGLNTDLVLANQLQRSNTPPSLAEDSTPVPAAVPAAAPAAAPARVAAHTTARRGGFHLVARRPDVARTVAAIPTPAGHTAATAHSPAATAGAGSQAGEYDAGRTSDGEVVAGGPAAHDTGVYDTQAPRADRPAQVEPQSHGGRDAVLGTLAGAIIGAATGHGVRGALVGAAAGGVLGAVYGGSIDRSFGPYAGYGASPAGTPSYASARLPRGARGVTSFRVPTYRAY